MDDVTRIQLWLCQFQFEYVSELVTYDNLVVVVSAQSVHVVHLGAEWSKGNLSAGQVRVRCGNNQIYVKLTLGPEQRTWCHHSTVAKL